MSSRNRSTRSSLRRKMVLPVTVLRQNGQEKQLAHTLDLTEVSARLGGLVNLLEPGEIIEIQRGAIKAKFQVFWMGAPGSAMEGQAGVRSIEPNKNIWGIALPSDESDTAILAAAARKEAEKPAEGRPSTEKRWHTRFECSGGASVRAENGEGFPVHGQVKDIAQGGVYVETTTPLTVNTEVFVKMNVEDIQIEAQGVVRTSYPMVGMGISFQNITPENQKRVDRIIQSIRAKAASLKNASDTAFTSVNQQKSNASLQLDAYPVRTLTASFRALTADFDRWKASRPAAELDEFRVALAELQQKLSPAPQIELLDFLSSTVPQGGHA